MTDKQDLIREIHEYVTTHGGENTATHLLVQAASAIQTQAAELEAVGAGGVQALSAAPVEVADPNEALRKLHESRAGYLKPLDAARTHALRMEQAAPKVDGFYEAVNDMDGLYQAAPRQHQHPSRRRRSLRSG